MLSLQPYDLNKESLYSARAVLALDSLYNCFRGTAGKAFAHIAATVTLPVVLPFGFWLYYKRKGLERHMRQTTTLQFKDLKEYVELRTFLSDFDKFRPFLKQLSTYKTNKAKWPLRYMLGQMQKTAITLLNYNSWLKSNLSELDKPQFKLSTEFKVVKEEELWANRNKAYQYWM